VNNDECPACGSELIPTTGADGWYGWSCESDCVLPIRIEDDEELWQFVLEYFPDHVVMSEQNKEKNESREI
jgi:hypothetical protein